MQGFRFEERRWQIVHSSIFWLFSKAQLLAPPGACYVLMCHYNLLQIATLWSMQLKKTHAKHARTLATQSKNYHMTEHTHVPRRPSFLVKIYRKYVNCGSCFELGLIIKAVSQ